MVNNYDKMQKMESVLTCLCRRGILAEQSVWLLEKCQKREVCCETAQTGQMSGTENGGDNLLVEHASGVEESDTGS